MGYKWNPSTGYPLSTLFNPKSFLPGWPTVLQPYTETSNLPCKHWHPIFYYRSYNVFQSFPFRVTAQFQMCHIRQLSSISTDPSRCRYLRYICICFMVLPIAVGASYRVMQHRLSTNLQTPCNRSQQPCIVCPNPKRLAWNSGLGKNYRYSTASERHSGIICVVHYHIMLMQWRKILRRKEIHTILPDESVPRTSAKRNIKVDPADHK